MKRAVVLALGVILALTIAAPTVLAQGNGGAPEDVTDTFTINPGDFPGTCSFSMLLELRGKQKEILQGNGGMIITSPGLHVTVTNLANGEQATFNITGAFHNTPDTPEPDQVTTVVTGRNFLIDPVAGTVLAIGNFSFVTDAEGNNVRPLEGKGQLIDVCALLG